jgi:integrase
VEQLSLFDLGVDMTALRGHRVDLVAAAERSASTRRAYESDWKRFQEWCGRAGRAALPADPDTVALYLTSVVTERKAVASAARYAVAIAHWHREVGKPSPIAPEVREVLAGARHKFGVASERAKAALTPAQLRAICRRLVDDGSAAAVRDRALLVLGFATGLRRSELSALDLVDVTLLPKHRVLVRVRRSKTDQRGAGRELGIFAGRRAETCPGRALKEWLSVRGLGLGPLFTRFRGDGKRTMLRLSAAGVAERLKACVLLIGLDPSRYGGHSLRAGCATAAYEGGAGDSAVMARTGHRSVGVMRRYLRSANLFALNPLAKAL